MGDSVHSMTLRLPHELYVELFRYARENDLSVAQVARQSIREKVGKMSKAQDVSRQLTKEQYETMTLPQVIELGVEDGKLGHLRINGIVDMNAVRQRMYAKGYAEGKATR